MNTTKNQKKMNKTEMEEISAKISTEILKTEKKISDYKELNQPIAPDCAIGRISRMDAINNKSVTDAALKQAEKKLEGLKYMQKTLGEEDFGLCQRCKQSIPVPRLLFMPQSQFCVNCAK